MLPDPRALFMLAVLVGVTGWVVKGLMMSFFKIRREGQPSTAPVDLEERLRKIEAATSGLIVDVSAMREKERFMARLQAAAPAREPQRTEMSKEDELSPMVTQSIPVIPRARR
jgi:hypothetical protein